MRGIGTGGTAGMTRRRALAATAGALAAVGVGHGRGPRSARAGVQTGGGIAGGGLVETADGEVQVSLFGSRLTCEGDREVSIFGSVRWTDPGWRSRGLALVSTAVIEYGPPDDDENARELRGLMSANGNGRHPFLLRAVDVDVPGAGQDRVRLVVGAAAGTPEATPASDDFAYEAEGRLVSGDFQLLSFDPPPDA